MSTKPSCPKHNTGCGPCYCEGSAAACSVKERQILFSAPMVCALLEGRKMQTRRIDKYMVKYPPTSKPDIGLLSKSRHGESLLAATWDATNGKFSASFCTYGKPGDRLWVREAWRIGAWDEGLQAVAIDYLADGFCRDEWLQVPDIEKEPPPKSLFKRKTTFERLQDQSLSDAAKAGIKADENGIVRWEKSQSPCRIRPSIHMPRWASRILLEITNVRVERLQEISEADAIAEGIEQHKTGLWLPCAERGKAHIMPQRAYRDLWESINGPGSWDANPWVWVIEFKMAQP